MSSIEASQPAITVTETINAVMDMTRRWTDEASSVKAGGGTNHDEVGISDLLTDLTIALDKLDLDERKAKRAAELADLSAVIEEWAASSAEAA